MNPRTPLHRYLWLIAVAVLSLLPAASIGQQAPGKQPISLTVTVMTYRLEKAAAQEVLAARETGKEASPAYARVTAMAGSKKATLTTLVALAMRSGQRCLGKSAHASIELDPVVGPDGRLVRLNGFITLGARTISLAGLTASVGTTVVAGQLEDPAASTVEVAFLRVQSQ